MNKKEIFTGFTLLIAIACVATFTLNMINGKFLLGDFKVYYSAAMNLISGKPVYLISFYTGSGFYKYSPAILFFFLPYLLFSFKIAAIIHFFILGIAYWYTLNLIRKLIGEYFSMLNVKHEMLLISISFICILIHFTREMYLGNINIILLMLCCLSIRNILTGKALQGGILFGIVILTKPYLLILLLPLLLRKKWRVIGSMSLTVAFGLLLPFLFFGIQKSIGLYGDWMQSVLVHGEQFPGMTSIDYFIRFLIPSWPVWGIAVIFFILYALAAILILSNLQKEKQKGIYPGAADMNFMFEWFLLIAVLPNLIKTDWVVLLFSAPLIVFMIFYIAYHKKYVWIPVLFILLFFYGANSDDLLGRSLSHAILQSGLMGLSNFFLIIASLFMFLSHRKRML